MADSFQGQISGPLKTVRDTLRDDTEFNQAIGNDFGKMTYPAASLLPQSSQYQNELEYADQFTILFVLEKGTNHIDLLDATEKVEEATDQILEDLENDSQIVKEFKPINFQYFVAENNSARLNVIEVQWQVTKLQDFA